MAYNPFTVTNPNYKGPITGLDPRSINIPGISPSYSTPSFAGAPGSGTAANTGIFGSTSPTTPTTPSSPSSSILTGLQSGLQTLSSYLTSLTSGGGGGYSGGATGGGGGATGGASINYATQQSIPAPAPIASSFSTPSFFVNPASGLANELVYNDKKKMNEAQVSAAQQNNAGVPTRTSLVEKIYGQLAKWGANVGLKAGLQTPTGTTLPPAGQEYVPSPYGGSTMVSPALAEYMKQQGANATNINVPITNKPVVEKTGGTNAGTGGDVTIPPNSGPSYSDTSNIWNSIIQGINLANSEILIIKQELATAASQALAPGRTIEDAAALEQQIIAKAQSMYPEFDKLQGTITTIDKALMDASIGFRKSAEALRNNPDLSMWQQTRRLQELDDMQNYAPIFDGLSMKDLIAYRNQLADSMNYYSGLIKDATAGITGLTDLTTPTERLAKSAEYLGKGVEYSTQYITQLQALAALLTPTYTYTQETNNATGVVTIITWLVDPITHKQTKVGVQSLGAIGQRTVTSAGTTADEIAAAYAAAQAGSQ